MPAFNNEDYTLTYSLNENVGEDAFLQGYNVESGSEL